MTTSLESPFYFAAGGLEISDQSLNLISGLLVVGGVFFLATMLEKYLRRLRIPSTFGVLVISLTLVLAVGSTPLRYGFDQIHAFHTVSLALILFYAGLKTRFGDIRSFLGYGITLAVAGVIISSLLLGGAFYLAVSNQWIGLPVGLNNALPFGIALLIGSCLGSTDASPTLNILRKLDRVVPERVKSIIQFESTINDPAAVVFFGVITEFTFDAKSKTVLMTFRQIGEDLLEAFGNGIIIGGLFGFVGIWLINQFVQERNQLLVASISIACLTYGTSQFFEGSGYLSAFVSGMFLNQAQFQQHEHTSEEISDVIEPFNDAAEVFIILLFGLSIHPADLVETLPAGLLVAGLMMFVARPISVLMFQSISPLTLRESLLVSWCGLRGVVPLALSFEMAYFIQSNADKMAIGFATELAKDATSIVFIVVMVNLVVQSTTITPLARWLNRPDTTEVVE